MIQIQEVQIQNHSKTGGKNLLRTEAIETIPLLESGREVDPEIDSELIRLTALNLELAVRNLANSRNPPSCLTISADICTHTIVATPTDDGEIRVLVYDR